MSIHVPRTAILRWTNSLLSLVNALTLTNGKHATISGMLSIPFVQMNPRSFSFRVRPRKNAIWSATLADLMSLQHGDYLCRQSTPVGSGDGRIGKMLLTITNPFGASA